LISIFGTVQRRRIRRKSCVTFLKYGIFDVRTKKDLLENRAVQVTHTKKKKKKETKAKKETT
jgi:hypothetical protein